MEGKLAWSVGLTRITEFISAVSGVVLEAAAGGTRKGFPNWTESVRARFRFCSK